ncbi:MAG: enoyl-ACP reductase [Candidatus Lambdaproteobacteria bacterium]|nr:enoyl-ACP reductase [Candidatus Lambdaproteobacteria bacterium]
MNDLKDKIALVTGVANKRSIAYGIAEDFAQQGAHVVVSYLPMEREHGEDKLRKLVEELGEVTLLPLDVRDEASMAALFAAIRERWERLDVIVHSIAMSKREELDGRISDTSLEGFLLAHEVSAYSLLSLVRHGRPLMTGQGGSVLAMSYIGAERASKNYNVMGAAKAALEANVRYLAMELGPEKIRVNAISAGPIRTLSASGIRDFLDLLHDAEAHSALKRNVTVAEVAHTATFLASDRASGITGQTIYVDGGYNIYG